MITADLEAADEIAVAAYGGPHRRKGELARYLSLQPAGWMLAVRDGTPAGLGGAIVYGPFAYIGLMAVHPALQRQGIAQAILERLLAWLQVWHCPVVILDASAMGQSLYAKLGFVEDDKVVQFVRDDTLALHPSASPASPAHAEDLPALVAFDTPIFGASRAHVLASYLAGDAGRAWLTRDNTGAVTGYLVVQERTLGPWVARSPADAEALLTRAVSRPVTLGLQALVPAANHAASTLLERYGFKVTRTLSHMRLGGTGSPVDRALIYGQASFALG
jgi:GNAT superfamily N-acetyltransferase